ncbi:MAG: hypothetical protein R3Y58_03390 [Eubacteriales bacterium]
MKLFDKLFKKDLTKSIVETQTDNIPKKITPEPIDPFEVYDYNFKLVLQYWGDHDYGLNDEVDKLLEPYAIRIERIVKITELCIPADTNDKLYYAAKGFLYAGAQYRDKAIEYLEKLIAAGGTWGLMTDSVFEYDGETINQKTNNIASIHKDLGECYEADYRFDDALTQYCIANALVPSSTGYICSISNVYVKKNELTAALKVFNSAQQTIFYSKDSFKEVIDRKILDIEQKIEKGYVYRPRKKNR